MQQNYILNTLKDVREIWTVSKKSESSEILLARKVSQKYILKHE